MGRLRLVQAACGFGQRALSGFFIDLILARHFDRGALLTPAVVVSFYANARKAFRSRTIGGFCDSRAAAWNPDAAIEAVRVANSPVVAIRSISVDVWHGGSITAMTTLFSCACRRLFCERMARCCRSIRCEGRRGRGKAGACGAPHQSAGQMELIENIFTKQRLATEGRSRLRVICATPIQKRPSSHRSKRFLCCVCRSVR